MSQAGPTRAASRALGLGLTLAVVTVALVVGALRLLNVDGGRADPTTLEARPGPKEGSRPSSELRSAAAPGLTEDPRVPQQARTKEEVGGGASEGRSDPQPEVLGNFVYVRGVVRDGGGQALPGATVFCDSPYATTETGADGKYELRVKRGTPTFFIAATHPRFVTARVSYQLSPGAIEVFIDLHMHAGAHALVRIVDGGRDPVAGARVRFWRSPGDGSTLGTTLASGEAGDRSMRYSILNGQEIYVAISDETGTAEVLSLTEGTYQLDVRAEGFVPASREGIEVPPFAFVDAGELVLEAGRALHGTVVDCQGTPIAGAVIRGLFDFKYLETQTDEFGGFVLAGIPSSVDRGMLRVTDPESGAFFDDRDFRLQAEPAEVRLCTPTIELLLHDAETGTGLDGPARIEVLGASQSVFVAGPAAVRDVEVRDGEAVLGDVASEAHGLEVGMAGYLPVRVSLPRERRETVVRVPLVRSGGLVIAGPPDDVPRSWKLEMMRESIDSSRTSVTERTVFTEPGPDGRHHLDARYFPREARIRVLLMDAERPSGEALVYVKERNMPLPTGPVPLPR